MKVMNQGRIVVHVAKNKEKYFTVVAENNKVIATSETYKTDCTQADIEYHDFLRNKVYPLLYILLALSSGL